MTEGAPTTDMPQPTAGSGSDELVTDSTDVAVLQEMLTRARERLQFYEGFDKLVGENVKRSGELMLEASQLRETANANAKELAQARAEFDATLEKERDGYRTLLTALGGELDSLQQKMDEFRTSLQRTLSDLNPGSQTTADPPEVTGHSSPVTPDSGSATTDSSDVTSHSSPVTSHSSPVTSHSSPVTDHRVIDVLIHGVTGADVAIQVQKQLSDVLGVMRVEPREFAEGVLRMQVNSSRLLTADDFTGWTNPLRVLREQSNVIEASLG